ncbi:cadherin domain-containing protein, partial [Planktomarina sp.]|nr:cadherin domain-containing protein [Planktomarina sp.]
MAFSQNNDEKNFYGYTFSSGQLDLRDTIYDNLSYYGELAPNAVAYGELTSVNGSLGTDVDLFSLGTLSTGSYRVDVDDYTWDWLDFDSGSVSQFSVLNAFGTIQETSFSVYTDLEFTVSSSADYWVEIKGPIFLDAQYSVKYEGIVTNNTATFFGPTISGEIKVGETVTASISYTDLDGNSDNGMYTAWYLDDGDLSNGLETFLSDFTSTDDKLLLEDAWVGKTLFFTKGFYDDNGNLEQSWTGSGTDGLYEIGIITTSDSSNAAPEITSASTASVDENSSTSNTIYTVTARDPDGETITYGLSGDDAEYFSIDTRTGAISLQSSADFEGKSSYSISATANDGTLSDSKNVKINVSDLNESPSITSSSSSSFNENADIATVAYSITANDPDSDSLTYSISGADADYFTIDTVTGEVFFKARPDYETKALYALDATVSDGSLGDTASISVSVNDINEASNQEVSGQITSDTNWSGTINVTGSIKVTDGTLTIEPGTIINVVSGNSAQIWFDGGQLDAQGTASKPIVFQSSENNGWTGLRFSGDDNSSSSLSNIAGSRLDNVHVSDASVGVHAFQQGISISNSEFENNDYGLVIGAADGVAVQNTNFSSEIFDVYNPNASWSYVIYGRYDSHSNSASANSYVEEQGGLLNAYFDSNDFSKGVSLDHNGGRLDQIHFTTNVFGPLSDGLNVGNSSGQDFRKLVVEGNAFSGVNGVALTTSMWSDAGLTDIDIIDNSFNVHDVGVNIPSSTRVTGSINIERNIFSGSSEGVKTGYANSFNLSPVISGNLFYNVDTALSLPGTSPTISNNTFVDTNVIYDRIGTTWDWPNSQGGTTETSFLNNDIVFSKSSTFSVESEEHKFDNNNYDFSGNYFSNTPTVIDGSTNFDMATITFSSNASAVNNTNGWHANLLVSNGSAFNQGKTVTADPDLINESYQPGSVTYQWSRNGSDIQGATSQSYVLTQDDVGAVISVSLSYLDSNSVQKIHSEWMTAPVVNVNDAPIITSSAASSIAENQTISTVVYKATGTDLDGDNLNYSLAGTDSSYFEIDGTSGSVTLKSPADFETKASFSIEVVASDGVTAASKTVQVDITDENDAPDITLTSLDNPNYYSSLHHHPAPYEASLWQYVNSATYGGSASNYNGSIELNTDGSIGLTGSYAGENDLNSTQKAAIDAGGFTKVFAGGWGGYAAQNKDGGLLVLGYSANDLFNENSPSGVDHAKLLDANIVDIAFSYGGGAALDYLGEIHTWGHAGYAPETIELLGNKTLEDAAYLRQIITADQDAGDLVEVTSPNLPSWLSINSTDLTLTGIPRNSDVGSHDFDLIVTDENGLSTSINYEVNVKNTNDAPSFMSNMSWSFEENIPSGDALFTAVAHDDDGDVLIYSLSGVDAGYFDIDSSSGEVFFLESPNFEEKSFYEIKINASDASLIATQSAAITISDTNDVPIFTSSAAFNFDEDLEIGSSVFTVQALDEDGDDISYSIRSDSNSMFGVNSDTGEIVLTGEADFETVNNYQLEVTASDALGYSTQSINVSLNDIQENYIQYTLPSKIDLSGGDTWATITASSSLDVDEVIFQFDERFIYDSSTYGYDFIGVWGYSDSWDDGRSGAVLDIGGNNAVGTIALEQIEITKKDGNEIIITQAELESQGLETSFEFVSGMTETPLLPASNFDPTSLSYTLDSVINIGSAGGDFTISASAEHTSDIRNVVFWLDSELHRSSGSSYSHLGLYGYSDSWEDGAASQTFALNEYNNSGTVDIQKVEVRTGSGVDYIYYENDLASLGLQTSFSISNQNDSYTASDVTEPNQNFATAYDVNSKASNRLDSAFSLLSGLSISSTEDIDFYLIEVSDDEQFAIDLVYSSDVGDLDLVIYDEQRNYIDSSFDGIDIERVTISQAGTYYVEVFGYDGAKGNYSINAQSFAGIAEDIYEDNDTFETAFHFGTQSSSVSGYFEDLTIDKAGDDDYYAFTIDAQADLEISVSFDHDKGDLDVRFLDSAGNWLAESTTTSDEEKISLKGLAAGDYYFVVYGYEGATSSAYSVTSNLTLDSLPDNADAYEGNSTFLDAYDLGNIAAAQIAVTNSNFHDADDKDFYRFSLNDDNLLGLEVLFSHIDGDLDIELLDGDGNWIDASTTGSDNEYISLSGLAAGTYTLNAYGYNAATIDNYSVRFVEESTENWTDSYDNYWDWQQASEATNFTSDIYEDNDIFDNAATLGAISTNISLNNLTIDSSGDADWFRFTYDQSTRVNVGISFDGAAADLDMELFTAPNQNFITENWIDGSYGVDGNEEISLFGLASGDYYVKIYEYNDATIANYELSFEVLDGTDINNLHDNYETHDNYVTNNSFETAYDMGTATGEDRVGDLTLTTGDEDWYKAYFVNDGTPNQYISAMFDHQDGDIDIELYNNNGSLLRSSKSATDNETIYLSDIEGGSYYYMRIFAYGDTAFQEYSLDYAFPVEVSEATINADASEGTGGNETYSSASSVALVSATENLTLHTATDQDWYSFEMRNASSSSSEISVSYDAALGAMNLSLWAVDVGASAPTLVAATASGTGREVINFDSYLAGTYYLKAFGPDGALIPDYRLSMDVTELEGSGSQSNVIPADQFDRVNSNDTSSMATDLGTLSTMLTIEDLTIHSDTDKDFLQFKTAYAGETQINIAFSHLGGDIDAILTSSNGTEIAYGSSGDDDETISFQSSGEDTYTLEVYGFDSATHRDYDLTITPKQLNSRRDDYESNDTVAQAVDVRDARASFNDLTLHNSSDQDWFK